MYWYLNLDAGMLFPVDPYYTEMYYVDFDEPFSMFALNYLNNADEKQMLEAFETREEALAMLAFIAKKLDAINYTEEEEITIDWGKYYPDVAPIVPLPYIVPYVVPDITPTVYPPYVVTCDMKAPDRGLVWYESKGELNPVK